MKINFKMLIILGLIFSVSILGCVSLSSKTASTEMAGLEVATLLKFDDVPIPAGFKFLPKDSFSFQNDIFRVALLRYTGRGSGETVVKFYKDQMPLYRWELVNVVEYGIRTLNFERPDETCTIVIDTKGSKSNISISVAPRASGGEVDLK